MTGGAPTRFNLAQGFGVGMLVMVLKNPDASQGSETGLPGGRQTIRQKPISAITRELLQVDQRPSVDPLSDLHALIVDSLNGKTKLPFLHFLKRGRDGDALADARGSKMPHIYMKADTLLVFIQIGGQKLNAGPFHQPDHGGRGENGGNARSKVLNPHLRRYHRAFFMG